MGWYGLDSGMACQWGLGTGAWSPLWARRPNFWARGAHFWRLVRSGSPGSHFGHPVPIMALHGLIPSGAHSLAVVPMDEFCGHQPTPCSFVGSGCPFWAQRSIFWEQLGCMVRLLKGYLKNGAIDHAMDQVCTTLASMAEEIQQWHPAPCEHQEPQRLKVLVDKLLSEKLVTHANGALLLTNDCLARGNKRAWEIINS